MLGLTKTAAIEYSAKGIRVNSVGPGFIRTPLLDNNLDEATLGVIAAMHPIQRLGTAQEVADLVAFLCSDEASFCTGGYYLVDGAYTPSSPATSPTPSGVALSTASGRNSEILLARSSLSRPSLPAISSSPLS